MSNIMNFKLGQDAFTTLYHNKEVTVEGIVRTANLVTPELITATFKCGYCGKIVEVTQGGGKCKLLYPETCSNKDCDSPRKKFKFLQDKSKFLDYQEIWLAPLDESRMNLGKGQKVILKNKLVGSLEGENIRVTGKLGFELKGRTNFAIPIVIATKIKQLD